MLDLGDLVRIVKLVDRVLEAEVEKLLQSGKLNQQQLNQLQQMAKQFQSLMQ